MTHYPQIEVTPAAVRAAQGRRREVHNMLPPNIDRRTPLEQWDARVAAICDRALLHLSFNAELAAEMEQKAPPPPRRQADGQR